MATVNDVARGALLRLGVLDYVEDADADAAELALTIYNGLMAEQVEAGWLASFSAQALSDDVPLGGAYIEPLKAAVAVRISPVFGVQVPPRVAIEASRFFGMLANDYWTTATNTHDTERGVWDYRPGSVVVPT